MAALGKSPRGKPALPADVRLTSADRVVYAEQGITKRDLALYYAKVADLMLPHVSRRPLALVRCPSGMRGDCFYQKHPPAGMSGDVGRIEIEEKSVARAYVYVEDLRGLIALVQFGTLEIHAWGSRIDNIERPDRLVFDLDPGPEVDWPQIVEAALRLREILETLGLKCFVKTSGGKGLHVVLPIVRRHSWDQCKAFAKSVADFMTAAFPQRYVAHMAKAARRGKIFIDYLRNQRGATAVAAYSTRARAGAPVSMPVDWKDLKRLKSADQFCVAQIDGRLSTQKRDSWRDIAKVRQSIGGLQEKLSKISF